jgi:hypothetical protein
LDRGLEAGAVIDLALFLLSSLPTGSGSGASNFGRFNFFVEYSFWKNEFMLGFEIDPFQPFAPREPADDRRQHSDRGDEPRAMARA